MVHKTNLCLDSARPHRHLINDLPLHHIIPPLHTHASSAHVWDFPPEFPSASSVFVRRCGQMKTDVLPWITGSTCSWGRQMMARRRRTTACTCGCVRGTERNEALLLLMRRVASFARNDRLGHYVSPVRGNYDCISAFYIKCLNAFIHHFSPPSSSSRTSSTATILPDSCVFNTENKGSVPLPYPLIYGKTEYTVAFWRCAPFALQLKMTGDGSLKRSDYKVEKQTTTSSLHYTVWIRKT